MCHPVCLQQVEDRATRIQESLLQQLRRGQTDEDLRRAAILFGMGTGMVLVTRQVRRVMLPQACCGSCATC